MAWYDKAMIAALLTICCVLIVAFAVLGERVRRLDDHTPVTIVEPIPTTPPTTAGDRCPGTFFLECT